MTDVLFFQTNDGGEITVENGEVLMDDALGTAVFLSLFGGNADDSGLPGDLSKQWWGNFVETDDARKYRSETGYLIESLPLTTANLRKLEDAAMRDLAWLDNGIATDLAVVARLPRLNTVRLEITGVIDGEAFAFAFLRSSAK